MCNAAAVLYELTFDIALTNASIANRPLYEFSLARPDFRRRVQEVRFTRTSAWLSILTQGDESTLDEYEKRFGKGPGTLAVEARRLASGPGVRYYFERHREPKSDDEETVWHLVALDVGTDARIRYDTGRGKSRVSIVHTDRAALKRFYATLVRLDEYGEVQFVSIRPITEASHEGPAPDDAKLLRAAWQAGYYEVPRRTTLRTLGRKLGLPATTLGWRLRRLEATAVAQMLGRGATLVDPVPRAK